MGDWMQRVQQVMETIKEKLDQKQVEQHKENNGTPVEITSRSWKWQKYDESSHENFSFEELVKRAKERAEGDNIIKKKLQDEENVEEKHHGRVLLSG